MTSTRTIIGIFLGISYRDFSLVSNLLIKIDLNFLRDMSQTSSTCRLINNLYLIFTTFHLFPFTLIAFTFT